jgi:hypothetical protein
MKFLFLLESLPNPVPVIVSKLLLPTRPVSLVGEMLATEGVIAFVNENVTLFALVKPVPFKLFNTNISNK